jgi:fused signal recognition particle receptor
VAVVLGAGAATLLIVAWRVSARLRARRQEHPPERAATPSEPGQPSRPAPVAPDPQREQRRRLKAEEEERKRAAYRARKQAEIEEKAARLRAEEELRAREAERVAREAEEAARRQAEAEAQHRQRVASEAGKTLAQGLAKTRAGFFGRLNELFGPSASIDTALLGRLEEVLFSADVGVTTAGHLLEFARQQLTGRERSDPRRVQEALRQEILRLLTLPLHFPAPSAPPRVWMVVGVNGSGKTTSVGKLAAQFAADGKKVVVAAADTFRAAATEQLEIWSQRAGATMVRGPEGSDPGSVAFEAVKRATDIGADLLLVDTAGRLHTKQPLMEELKKVRRILDKVQPGAPEEILLVLDATNGQNAIAQARQFHEALGVTGIVLTKLDGTAKGGVVIGICDELKIPVRYIGVGEAVGDLLPFDPEAFVAALFDETR